MEKDLIGKLHKSFEEYMHTDENGSEYWYARELQGLLDYAKWDTFKNVIEKAKDACKNSGGDVFAHFPDVGKTSKMPNGGVKEVLDYKLTRYACYLIAQNGDPRKEVIAFAQTYFAVQTRKQEVIEQRLLEMERVQARHKLTESDKQLSKVIFEHGVNNEGFGRIKSKGDEALFGKATRDLKKDFNISNSKPLADVLPTITLKAKDFANEITAFNTAHNNLNGEEKITKEHIKNNKDVRKVLTDRNIYPEKLPPEEDIKKLERRMNKEAKQLADNKQKKINKGKNKAFSVAEAMIALLIGSLALGMAAPMITKQIKQSNFTDTQFQVINSRIEQLQQALNDRENIFPSGFLMMTFESCPTNGWSDVSALYEGRFLKISSDAQVTHDAILPEHSHGVGFFSQSGNDDVYFWYKETIDSYRLKYAYNTRWVPGEAGYVSSLNKSANASISYGILTTKEIYDADANTLEPKSITVKVCRRN